MRGPSGSGEVARVYMNFRVVRWIDEVIGGSVTPNWVLGDELSGGIELIEFKEGDGWINNIRKLSVQEWREPELSQESCAVSFQDVTIGDKSYAVSFYPKMDLSPSNIDYGKIGETKSVRICFIKGNYYVQVHFFGSDEKLVGAFGKGPPSSNYQTLEPYPTERSVVTVEKILPIARIIEAKLPGGAATTELGTSATVATSDGHLPVPPSSSNVVTTVAEAGAVATGAVALGWFLAPWAWDVAVWLLRGRSILKGLGRLNRFSEWVNQPRQVRGMGDGGTVNREGDYAYVTGNRDGVTFVSSEDVAREVNYIKNEIDSSTLSPGEKESLKMHLEQNKHDELEKKKILDAARGSHIGY